MFVFSLSISPGHILYGICQDDYEHVGFNSARQDTLKGNQILYNGRVWRNLYYRVREDQFLFSDKFLQGTVSINGESFKDLFIRYDIHNDEIMTPTNHGVIMQLNKEMIDSFTFRFADKEYRFTKFSSDSIRGFNGYINVLYEGKSALYVKYKKDIERLAVEKKYDKFYQIHRMYFVKDSIIYPIAGKRDLFKILNEDKVQIRNFIKKNRLNVSKKRPESFIPVVGYYDSISQ
jgi:hypothetical protein